MKKRYLLGAGVLLFTLTGCSQNKTDEIVGHAFEYDDYIYKFQNDGHEKELYLGDESDNTWDNNTYSLEYNKEKKTYNLYVDGEEGHYVIKEEDIDEDGFIAKNKKETCQFKLLSQSDIKKHEKQLKQKQKKIAKKELNDVKVSFSGMNGQGKATVDDEKMIMNDIYLDDAKIKVSQKNKLKNGDKVTISLVEGKKELAKKEITVQGLMSKDFNVKNKAAIKKRLSKELNDSAESYLEQGKNTYRQSQCYAYSPKTGRVVGIGVIEYNKNHNEKKKKPNWEVTSSDIVTHKKTLILKNNEAYLDKDDDFYTYADVDDIANPGMEFDKDKATLNEWKQLLKKEGYILF